MLQHNYLHQLKIMRFYIFFSLIFFSTFNLVLSNNFIVGFPLFSLITTISLKLIPLEIPVPNAFEKASLAANLLAKQLAEFFFFYIL